MEPIEEGPVELLITALAIMDDRGRRGPQDGKVGSFMLWEHDWQGLRGCIYEAYECLAMDAENEMIWASDYDEEE